MEFYSTRNKKHTISLKEAVLRGLAEDRGLLMPCAIPEPEDPLFFRNIRGYSLQDISFSVARPFFHQDMKDHELYEIIRESLNFDIPLKEVYTGVYSLELFHGPTMAFKDVGARFMARLLGYFTRSLQQSIHVLVATSGDTGSAVGNGFWKIPGIRVHILYPSGLVSHLQEKQFTTLGHNINALEIRGTFDDCQRLVKEAFSDRECNQRVTLTSANSINLGRLLPQMFYYFYAFAQLDGWKKDVIFSVPSGNYGNLTAGLMAKKMKLPVRHFVVANNINRVVPEYLETGVYKPRESIRTIANAMDVGDPSNFERILELYGHSLENIRADLSGYSFTDEEIRTGIARLARDHRYIMDPHGATGHMALSHYLEKNPDDLPGIFLETAHPAKFLDEMETILNGKLAIPPQLQGPLNKKKESILMGSSFDELKEYLLQQS